MASMGLSQTEVSAAETLFYRKRWPTFHSLNQRSLLRSSKLPFPAQSHQKYECTSAATWQCGCYYHAQGGILLPWRSILHMEGNIPLCASLPREGQLGSTTALLSILVGSIAKEQGEWWQTKRR